MKTTSRSCRVCGCTDDHACPGPCWWVDLDPDASYDGPICSTCAVNSSGDEPVKVESGPLTLEDENHSQVQDENDSHLTSPRSFRSLELERIIIAALEAQDMPAVASALRMLATVDPRRAELIYQTMRVGIAIRSEATS